MEENLENNIKLDEIEEIKKYKQSEEYRQSLKDFEALEAVFRSMGYEGQELEDALDVYRLIDFRWEKISNSLETEQKKRLENIEKLTEAVSKLKDASTIQRNFIICESLRKHNSR